MTNDNVIDGSVHDAIRRLIIDLGEKPDREGLANTPQRVVTALRYLTRGYQQTVDEIAKGAVFPEESDSMVTMRDLPLYSLCEHHLLPFFGNVHVAYLPSKRIIGLSKIPRIVDMFAQRLQVQERLTGQIADALESVLQPRGVAVQVEATHMCMAMRGVEKQGAVVVTSSLRGSFRTDPGLREEFLTAIGGG